MELLPGIQSKGLAGGIEYFDGQFDDARLAVNLAQTCAEKGGVLLNYCKVTGLLKQGNTITGVNAIDREKNKEYHLPAKVVVNATGVFVDEISSDGYTRQQTIGAAQPGCAYSAGSFFFEMAAPP